MTVLASGNFEFLASFMKDWLLDKESVIFVRVQYYKIIHVKVKMSVEIELRYFFKRNNLRRYLRLIS